MHLGENNCNLDVSLSVTVHTLYFPCKATAPVSAEQITFIILKKMYLGIVVFSVAAILRVGIINNHIQ